MEKRSLIPSKAKKHVVENKNTASEIIVNYDHYMYREKITMVSIFNIPTLILNPPMYVVCSKVEKT